MESREEPGLASVGGRSTFRPGQGGKGPEAVEKQLPPDAHAARWLEHGRESGAQGPALCQCTLPCLGLFLPTRKIFKDISGFHILTCGDSGPLKGPSENSLLRRFRVVGMAGSFQ